MKVLLIVLLNGLAITLSYLWFMNRNNCLEKFIRKMQGKPEDFWVWKNAGEAETTTKPTEIPKELQPVVDHIIESRLAREKAKYSDYDSIKTKLSDYEKQQDAKAQRELEDAKKYDEAKKTYETQIGQHKEIITKKDQEIIDLKLSHNLTNEISKQGGYIEETIALLKSSAVLIDGNVFINSKDANGIDNKLPIAEGVKRFLEARPHLVKSNFKPGGGGQATTTTTVGQQTTDDLTTLNNELNQAMRRGDLKGQKEASQKIRAALNAQKK